MIKRVSRASAPLQWLAVATSCGLFAFSSPPADRGPITFQANSALPESAGALVGHWRKTTIVFESPRDEHLVLHANGQAENWVVTASGRSEPKTGSWRVEGKTIKLDLGEDDRATLLFTLHEGQLVLPNVPGRRQFWDKVK